MFYYVHIQTYMFDRASLMYMHPPWKSRVWELLRTVLPVATAQGPALSFKSLWPLLENWFANSGISTGQLAVMNPHHMRSTFWLRRIASI